MNLFALVRTGLTHAARALVQTLLPSPCAACGAELERVIGPTCATCRERLAREIVATRCAACSAPLADAARRSADDTSCCGACANGRRLRIHAPRAHDGVARQLLHAFKYRGRRDIAELLARETLRAQDVASSLQEVDLIVPIPGDPVRRHERGFDATALLARELCNASREMGAACPVPRVLRALRVRRAAPQVGRGAVARRAAPAGTMSARWPAAILVRGRRVALVDDVVTTGATLREAERVLLRLGARSVVALACTRARGEVVGATRPRVRRAERLRAGRS